MIPHPTSRTSGYAHVVFRLGACYNPRIVNFRLYLIHKWVNVMALESSERSYLLNFMRKRLSLSELKDVIFELGLSSDNFQGNLNDVVRDLIAYCQRCEMLYNLLIEVLKIRPDPELAKINAKLSQGIARTKVLIVIGNLSISDNAGVQAALALLAQAVGISQDQIQLLAVQEGSAKLLISIPEDVVIRLLDLHLISLGKYEVRTINTYNSINHGEQERLRKLALSRTNNIVPILYAEIDMPITFEPHRNFEAYIVSRPKTIRRNFNPVMSLAAIFVLACILGWSILLLQNNNAPSNTPTPKMAYIPSTPTVTTSYQYTFEPLPSVTKASFNDQTAIALTINAQQAFNAQTQASGSGQTALALTIRASSSNEQTTTTQTIRTTSTPTIVSETIPPVATAILPTNTPIFIPTPTAILVRPPTLVPQPTPKPSLTPTFTPLPSTATPTLPLSTPTFTPTLIPLVPVPNLSRYRPNNAEELLLAVGLLPIRGTDTCSDKIARGLIVDWSPKDVSIPVGAAVTYYTAKKC